MKQSGELVDWNDARGFGFIAGDDGQRYFVHISAIGRIVNRPRAGDRVSFLSGKGKDGRPQANAVMIAGANPRPEPEVLRRGLPSTQRRFDWRMPLATVLAALVFAGIANGSIRIEIGALYAVMGSLSFFAYWNDKRSAEAGRWRTTEAQLLGVDLCFGIIGGLAGQSVFRHKTRKPTYVTATILLAGVHLLWLGGLAAGLIDVWEVLPLLGL